jgi:hypothetical protein
VVDEEFRERGAAIMWSKVDRRWRSWVRLVRNFAWDRARLEGDQDFLTIYRGGGLGRGAVMLSRVHVTSIQLRQGWGLPGVRFELDDDDLIILFCTEDAERLLYRLEMAGWGTRAD